MKKKTLILRVEGEPGSGKSTLLWQIVRALTVLGYNLEDDVEAAGEHSIRITSEWKDKPNDPRD